MFIIYTFACFIALDIDYYAATPLLIDDAASVARLH